MRDDFGSGFLANAARPTLIAVEVYSRDVLDAVPQIEDDRLSPGPYAQARSGRGDGSQRVERIDALGPLPALTVDVPSVGVPEDVFIDRVRLEGLMVPDPFGIVVTGGITDFAE